MDLTLVLTIVPPVFAAIVAYAIARRKAAIQEAKISADAQTRAMELAGRLVAQEGKDVRDELKKELDKFREDNSDLRNELKKNKEEIDSLRIRLHASDELIATLRAEITSLRKTIELYENQIYKMKEHSR